MLDGLTKTKETQHQAALCQPSAVTAMAELKPSPVGKAMAKQWVGSQPILGEGLRRSHRKAWLSSTKGVSGRREDLASGYLGKRGCSEF